MDFFVTRKIRLLVLLKVSEYAKFGYDYAWRRSKSLFKYCFPGGTRHRLPKELSMLVNLRHVLVKKGEITGTIPPSIFELSSLKRLDLDKNDMSGVIQVNVDSDIQRLDVNFNKFSGSIDFLQSFPNITEAHLDNNNFSGEIPASLGQLKNLRKY